MHKNHDLLVEEKMRLLEESLMLIERLKKMRSIGAKPKDVGINPHLLRASGLDEANSEYLARIIKRFRR